MHKNIIKRKKTIMEKLNFKKSETVDLDISCLQSALTERSYNILQAHFESLNDFIDYYKTNKNFLALEHCGGKTNREILLLIDNITIDNKPIEIDCYHVYSLDSYEKIRSENLEMIFSYRTFNTLSKNKLNSLKDIIEEYITHKKFSVLYGGGQVTNKELLNFMEIVCFFRAKLRRIIEIDGEELDELTAEKLYRIFEKDDFNELYNLVLLCSDNNDTLNLNPIFNKFYGIVTKQRFTLNEIIDEENFKFADIKKVIECFCKIEIEIDPKNIQFFKLIKTIIEKSNYFEDREVFILKRNFRFIKDEKKFSLRNTGEILDLTRERVRQIKLIIKEKLLKLLSVLALLYPQTNYSSEFEEDVLDEFVLISKDQFDKIRDEEKIDFSDKFISYIFSVLECDKYLLLNEFVRLNKFYLVERDFLNYFDMKKFLIDICHRHDEDVYKKERVPIDGILRPYVLNDKREYSELKKIVLNFLEKEKNQVYDDDYFIFTPTTRSRLEEVILELLEEYDKPMNLSLLFAEIGSKFYQEDLEKEKVRQICLRSKKIISLGKQSKYALRIWEDEKEYIKSGYAIDIAKELLEQSDEPLQKDKLIEYVSRYRDYEKTSIVNMISTHKDIVNFPLAFFGLKNRKYKGSYKCKGKPNQFLRNRIQRYIKKSSGSFTKKQLETDLRKRFKLSKDLSVLFIKDLLEKKAVEVKKNRIVNIQL